VLLAGVIRWVGLSAFAAMLGALTLDRFVLPDHSAVAAARRRLGQAVIAAAVVLLAASVGELVIRAMAMTGAGTEVAVRAIPAVLAHTHYGALWILRIIAVILVLIARSLPVRSAGLIFALVVAGTTALTGHAGDRGDWTSSALSDWIHIVCGGAWTGGLLLLAPLLLGSARGWPPAVLTPACRRFSRLATICLAAVLLTGACNAWGQIPDVPTLWSSVYGRLLLAKVALVAVLVAYGAANRFTVLPRLERGAAPDAHGRLRRYVAVEAVLALGVFAITAVLTDSTPPRHTGHTDHVSSADDEPDRPAAPISMEALHAGGGVPQGWRFTPPAGDPARGRQVFARLQCFGCHRVAGERFPAPAGPGPELTGMGHHHPPGYLLESVLNPNAVVVEGRGYTDARGRSVMPELARDLTVAELLDLVAYLRTL
jgi:putative copper resistance protein D